VRSVVIAPATLAQYALDVSSLPGMRAFLQRYGAWIGSGSPIAKVSVLPNSFVEWNVSRCYRT